MVRTIQIGKRRWLAGMTWSSYEDAPSKDELKEDAQRLGASWASVRVGESAIQGGFCAPIDGIKNPTKLFSLAAMLADSREQPWLGIFKIEEGVWWYVAVRDGHAILPDGDVIGGEAEIHAARERHSGYTDWKYIDGDISLLEEFINDIDAKPTPVRSLSGANLPVIPLMVSAVVLVSVMGGGYWWWHQNQLEQERAVAMAKVRAQMLADQKPVVLAPSPLLTTPNPNDWLSVCGNVVFALPLSQDGWERDQASCDMASVSIHWVRKDGATVANKPEGTLSPDGNTVDQAIQLVGLKVQGSNDAIDLPAAKLVLRAWAQAANFTLAMNEAAPAPVLPGANVSEQNKTGAPVARPQASIALDIPVSPFDMDMSSVPGLRLTSLRSTVTGWHVEGMLYGR
jgi:hypothetical protein